MILVGSLCTGIGGIDLGLERAGMRVAWQAEIDPFCRRVLRNHWPEAELHGDCKLFSRRAITSVFRRVDVIAAGYPCQPFSLAGRRRGADDPRHLWPAIRRIVGVLRPRWVLLENVSGHLSMGFGRVLGDLAELGFDCEWDVLSAAQFGAPHLRRRVFIVGRNRYAGHAGGAVGVVHGRRLPSEAEPARVGGDAADATCIGGMPAEQPRWRHGPLSRRDATDARHNGLERCAERDERQEAGEQAQRRGDVGGRGLLAPDANGSTGRQEARGSIAGPCTSALGEWETESRRCRSAAYADRADLRSQQGRFEPGRTGAPEPRHAGPIQRADGWHWRGPGGFWAEAESPVLAVADGLPRPLAGSRTEALRAIGNAVVPQVAEWIGRRIVEVEAKR